MLNLTKIRNKLDQGYLLTSEESEWLYDSNKSMVNYIESLENRLTETKVKLLRIKLVIED